MQKIGLVVAVILLCSVTLIPAFSEDDSQGNNYQADDNQERENKFDFGGSSNKTIIFDDSNETDVGHEISDYVHERNELEKEQRDKIHDALKECREGAKESGNKAAMQQCVQAFKSLREQYRSFVLQQNLQFKQYRQGFLTGNHNILTPEKNKQALDQVMLQISHYHANTFAGMHKNNRHR
ncbi:MAG: hypothetical protein KGI27_12255 [Thaumarchaeota archaeon]|nr:hypothetical protein [Nitrososphaerota archaeon]